MEKWVEVPMAKMGETGVKSEPSGVIGGAKPAHKVGNLKYEPSGVIGGAKPAHKVGNLKSEPSGVIQIDNSICKQLGGHC